MKKFLAVLLVIIIAAGTGFAIWYFTTKPQKETATNIYGVTGIGLSFTELERTDNAVNMSYDWNGDIIESDFDNAYPWSHIKQVTDKATGNVFIKIPKFYSKYTINSDNSLMLQISNTKLNGFSTLFLDGNGQEIDYVMIGAYESVSEENSNGEIVLKSISGYQPATNMNINVVRDACKRNGENYQQFDFMIMNIVNQLFTVEFATTNSQSVFYGFCHKEILGSVATGTVDSIGNATGSAVSINGAFKYRGIENLWGSTWTYVDGINYVGEDVYLSMTPSNYISGEVNETYFNIGKRIISEGKARGLKTISFNSALAMVDGVIYIESNKEYNLSDYTLHKSTGEILTFGGPSGYAGRAGIWCWYGDHKATSTNGYYGSRLCYKPITSFVEN